MKKPLMVLALSVLATTFLAGLAVARVPYYTEFKRKYYKPNGDETERGFAMKVDMAKCLVCHGKDAEGKKKKGIRNEYGKIVEEFLGGDKGDKGQIGKALDEAYNTKVADGSETYGDRIKAGKLPAGD